jgi:molybdopterin converting factor small subunit
MTHLINHLGIHTDEIGFIIINKKDATFSTPLKDGDLITMIPPIGGG